MQSYRAALIGCGRMGAFIDNEVAGLPNVMLPYSHAAGYEACPRTQLVAGSDMRQDVLDQFGERFGVGPEHRYTDYQELIRRERPEIVSIATQPHQRAEVALFAIEHGVRALYCEKPLCASMSEAAALREAVERNNIVFNMGTNRRWQPGFAAMRAAIAAGEIGNVSTLITFHRATLFNTVSHWVDTLRWINGDAPARWVQAFMPDGDESISGDRVTNDPVCEGTIAFANGVTAHLIATPGAPSHHAYGDPGELIARAGDSRFEVWTEAEGGIERTMRLLEFTPASGTLRLIEDLVQALDTGSPTQGGIDAAYANTEILFALLESHRRGGARVLLPLDGCELAFEPVNLGPRQPKYAAS